MKSVNPGMSSVFYAGMTYVMTDNNNQEYEVVCRESPEVESFLHAYDEYMSIVRMGIEGEPKMRAKAKADRMWDALPSHVVLGLPSSKQRTPIIPGG